MTRAHLRLANLCNGLPYPHDAVCYFQSQYGHHKAYGYFRMDSMPYDAVLTLLSGGTVEIIDATQHSKPLTDAQRYGVATWCCVFNRAIRQPALPAPWVTRDVVGVARSSHHEPLIRSIRRLSKIVGMTRPAVIGANVILTCHRHVRFDDKPELIGALMQKGSES